uniref:SFRICE_025862 n=1 Tax=Spodoptera frugiperda TaxID=7108 RepID=A0A2H1WNY1_SPOFR
MISLARARREGVNKNRGSYLCLSSRSPAPD